MLFTIIISLILIFSIYSGYKKGLAQEIIRIIGFLATLLLSLLYSRNLSDILFSHTNIISNHLLCNSISFLILFIILSVVVRFIMRIINHVTSIPVIHELNSFGGALISFIISYFMIFLILNIILVLPDNNIKKQYYDSKVATFVVNRTPLLSHDLYKKWLR
ncbi:CvpA family protein [Apilactobacillus micheneri]|uniref:CvpA family protein n=1 Tax=Apilactobacillus micheneri TaxID=1899430 RepID=A0A2S2JJH1_9LACO|nr:CvpA family protein [Apilactobacillus micheneri]TPR24366.1 CvpA family protein [Apilactobacillus micheneri]TPR25385.1 CvpA family protein [Apilactobacillus micheneri]TPR27697.1 CvpA family protein [Apilactobacillus micheneri]TPR28962.1 CvpA family protein [Apilactobacillus micheneri]TPR29984.1 CvpA family protein [Apilactobacillus micheneri]